MLLLLLLKHAIGVDRRGAEGTDETMDLILFLAAHFLWDGASKVQEVDFAQGHNKKEEGEQKREGKTNIDGQ